MTAGDIVSLMGELISIGQKEIQIKFFDVKEIKTPTANGVNTEYRVRFTMPAANQEEISGLAAGCNHAWEQDQTPFLVFDSTRRLKISNIEAAEDSPTPMMTVTVILSAADYRAIVVSQN